MSEKVRMRCSSCGREVELSLDDNRFCGSFGGLDPRKELRAGRMIDPCRGTMLAEGEHYEPPAGPKLDLKIESLDLSASTHKVSKLWKPIEAPEEVSYPMSDDRRLKHFRAVIEFQGYDNEQLRAAGLPPLDERIRECIETHPVASFRIDTVIVEELPNEGLKE